MIDKNSIEIVVGGFTHYSECGLFLPDMVEAFEHLLKASGYCFDGKLEITEVEL